MWRGRVWYDELYIRRYPPIKVRSLALKNHDCRLAFNFETELALQWLCCFKKDQLNGFARCFALCCVQFQVFLFVSQVISPLDSSAGSLLNGVLSSLHISLPYVFHQTGLRMRASYCLLKEWAGQLCWMSWPDDFAMHPVMFLDVSHSHPHVFFARCLGRVTLPCVVLCIEMGLPHILFHLCLFF